MDPPRDREEFGDGNVLDPEDLDISDEEVVEKLEESRFVIGAEEKPTVEEDPTAPIGEDPDLDTPVTDPKEKRAQPQKKGQQRGKPATEGQTLSGSDVKRWISANLQETDSQYAYRLAAKTGDEISHQQLASDDIGMAFDGLLMWYAQQVGQGTAVEDTLGILLAESNIRVRFPVTGMQAYLDEHDLSPEDSIEDLLSVIRDHDGLVFPRGKKR